MDLKHGQATERETKRRRRNPQEGQISRAQAEALGGRVGVMPNKPVGSIFWMRLPRAQKHDEVAIEVAQPVEVATAAEHELTYVGGEQEE